MESKFIFFLVLVSVTQNSVLLSSALDGLPEEARATVSEVQKSILPSAGLGGFPEEALARLQATELEFLDADNKTVDGFGLLFAKLCDDKINDTDAASILNLLGDAVAISANSISLFANESCTSSSTTDNDPRTMFNGIIATILEANKLARAEYNSENEAKIAEYKEMTLAQFIKLNQITFDTIRNCADDDRENTQALIRMVQDNNDGDVVQLVNNIYESVKSCPDLDGNAVAKTLRAARSTLQRVYALYDTIYIHKFLNLTDTDQEAMYALQLVRKQFKDQTFAILEVIESQYLDANQKVVDGFELLYAKLCDGRISDTDATSIVDILKTGVNVVVSATTLFKKKSCGSISTSDNGPGASINEVYEPIFKAIGVARGKFNPDNGAKIAKYQETSLAAYKKLVQNLFDIIRNCADDGREETQALIQEVQKKANADLIEVTKMIYESIKSCPIRDPNALENAISGVNSSVRRVYALLETLYIRDLLNLTDILESVFQLRFARSQVKDNVAKATETIFEVIAEIASKHFTAPEGSGADSNTYDFKALEKETLNYYRTASQTHLEAVLSTQPSSSVKVTVVKSQLPAVLRLSNSRYWDAISSITNGQFETCADFLSAINVTESIQSDELNTLYRALFSPLRNNATIAAESAPRLSAQQILGETYVQNTNSYIFQAINLAAKIICSNESSDTDYSTKFQGFQEQGVDRVRRAAALLGEASLLQFLLNNGYLV